MSPLISAEIVVGTLLLLALATLSFIYFRRRALSKDSPLMLCALRTDAHGHWRLGLLRFGGSSLKWFTLIGPSMRPKRTWQRPHLDLESPQPAREVIAGLPDAVTVECHHGGDDFELALAPSSYTAMRSWLESAPPGFNVNVA